MNSTSRVGMGEQPLISLAYLPPTPQQTRAARAGAAVLLLGWAVLIPFAATPLPKIDGFIPALDAIISVTDLITAGLLLAHFSITRSRALWALACGYLFSAAIVVAHGLTFPGVVSPTGNLGGSIHTNFRIYLLWHLGLPVALFAYVWLRDKDRTKVGAHRPIEIAATVAGVGVLALVSCLAWLALLPPVDPVTGRWLTATTMLICAAALSVLWVCQRSALDQWLMVVVLALIVELAITALIGGFGPRAVVTLGFYTGRLFSLVTSTVVLIALLAETSRLYAGVARADMLAGIVNASRTLSSEIELPKLIERLMKIALENADADRGLVILPSRNEYLIQAEARATGDQIEVTMRQEPIARITCPESVVRHVIRTRESVILDDTSKPGPFSGDHDLRHRQSKSILCLPLLKQGELTGILLLENTVTSHAFTPARIAVLELLTAQAAISFENARLYSELSRSEALLSEGQKLSLTGSFGWNVSNGELFWSDETSRILGCDPGIKQSMEFVFSRTHPDDFLRVKETLDRTTRDGTNLDFEHRLLLPDGAIKHVHVVARAADGRDGKEFVGAVMDVTAAHQTKMALEQAFSKLKKSEENFRLIVDNIPGFIVTMSAVGEAEFCNKRYLDFMGRTFEELKNLNQYIHPEDLAQLESLWGCSVQTGCSLEAEHRLLRAGGDYRWVCSRALPMRDEDGRIVRWYVSVDDIDDRKKAEEKLVRSEGFLAEGQRISSTGTFSWRLDTDEVLFSDELHRIFEFDRNSIVTLEQIGARVHPEDVPLLSTTIEQSRNGEGHFDYDIRLRMPDRRIKYLHTFSHTMRHQDGRLESLGAVQDITQRRLSDEALDKAQMELAHVSRMTTLGELTASIAHEVNQPLGSVVNNANACLSILSRGTQGLEEVREALAEIIEGAERASAVISRVRQLSKKVPYERTLVSLKDVVTDVLNIADNEAARRQVTIRTDLTNGLPSVLGDRIQLQQVLLNLVVNGMDAMSNVEPVERMMTISAHCETQDGKPEVLVSVRDVGSGLKPEQKDRLFEAFFSTKPEGMGMGLAISRSIIEAHGGRLWAETNQGAGATFLFSLPIVSQTGS